MFVTFAYLNTNDFIAFVCNEEMCILNLRLWQRKLHYKQPMSP